MQGILQINASERSLFGSSNLHETVDDPKTILINNTVRAVTMVGIDVPGQAQGMTRRLLNRGGLAVTLEANSAEAGAAQRFNTGAVIHPYGSFEIVCEGFGWRPLTAASATGDVTETLANEDTVSVSKAAVARVVT